MTLSFILTPLPIPTSNLRLNRPITPPPEDPHLQAPPTPEVFRHLKPLFHPEVEVMPAVGGEVSVDEDEDEENRTPSNDDVLLTMNLRPPTLLPTPMTLLINCVSALCADWNTISPKIAHKENAEESIHNSGGDVDLLFVGADPWKVERFERLLSVNEQQATGWQPTQDVPATPILQDANEMPDTSYDYNMELYGDGES
ncbi:hypothetical protein Moror_11728 [Moniliophthora roreri MCA 2997]|nr:hypothetical protein Moror_11728 [Moniliophthora roreri MCA 2997]